MAEDPGSFQEALAHHRAGRLREAEGLYRALIEKNPADPNPLRMLAHLAGQVGRNDIAADLLRQTVVLVPGDATVQGELGEMYRRLGQLDDALAACRRAVELEPRLPEAHFCLANVLKDAGDFDGAVGGYRRALALREDFPQAKGNLGLALQEQGDLDGAAACFEAIVANHPEDVIAHTSLGNVWRDKGELEKAVAAYQRALAVKPGHAVALNNLGKLLHDAGHVEEAMQHYQAAIAAAPERAEAYQNLGMALEKSGRTADAVAAYTHALQRGATTPEARYHMAAFTGIDPPAAAPVSHVKQVYDEMAPVFDATLERLGYAGPQLVFDAVLAAGGVAFEQVLDLGCGTGLCGPVFRPRARRLVGVDVSTGMIELARGRGVYDELHAAEMVAFLNARGRVWDLVIAADVLIYMGELQPLFAAVVQGLKPGGLFAFTIESGAVERYELRATRRYVHGAAYVRNLADGFGMAVVSLERAVLRREAGVDVLAEVGVVRGGGEEPARFVKIAARDFYVWGSEWR